jgi:hypothetical protein
MAITVTHSKVSTIPDDADTSLVRPSDWNADHALTGVIDVANGGTGAATLTGLVVGNGTSAMTAVTAPSGAVVGTSDSQTLTNKTLTNPTITNYTETLYSPAAGSAFTVALTDGTVQKFTTNANTTVTLPSSVAGKSFVIIIAYGGSHSITWAGGSVIKWAGGVTPTATAVNGKFDIFTFFQDGTNTYSSVLGQNY